MCPRTRLDSPHRATAPDGSTTVGVAAASAGVGAGPGQAVAEDGGSGAKRRVKLVAEDAGSVPIPMGI